MRHKSPLSSSLTPSLFYFRLETYLSQILLSTMDFSSPTGLISRICDIFFGFVLIAFSF